MLLKIEVFSTAGNPQVLDGFTVKFGQAKFIEPDNRGSHPREGEIILAGKGGSATGMDGRRPPATPAGRLTPFTVKFGQAKFIEPDIRGSHPRE
jgi:hypothetical protein